VASKRCAASLFSTEMVSRFNSTDHPMTCGI
jgi:hypothetical protein